MKTTWGTSSFNITPTTANIFQIANFCGPPSNSSEIFPLWIMALALMTPARSPRNWKPSWTLLTRISHISWFYQNIIGGILLVQWQSWNFCFLPNWLFSITCHKKAVSECVTWRARRTRPPSWYLGHMRRIHQLMEVYYSEPAVSGRANQ